MISWKCKHTWKKSAQNTAWCLLGCSIGDFGTIFYFQNNPSDIFNTTTSIMTLAIIDPLSTDVLRLDSFFGVISFAYFVFSPLIFVYLILYYFLPYLLEINASNIEESKKNCV